MDWSAFSGGGGAASYTYDGNGLRVVKSLQGGTTTVSIFAGSSDIAEYDNGAAPSSPSREYIYNPAGGATTGLLAMISGCPSACTTTYYHQDDLSVRLTTKGSDGSIQTQEGHFPFGELWYETGPTNKWFFTSYDRDSESGLDYALARYYDSRTGTFCSADPLAGDPSDPQSWNRYPYGRNDPINMTDPSGKSWWSSLLIDIGIGVAAYFAPELEGFLAGAGGGATAGTTTMTALYEGQIIGQGSATYAWGAESAMMGGSMSAMTQQAMKSPQTPQPPARPTTPQAPMKDCPPTNAHGIYNNIPTSPHPNKPGAFGVPETPGTAAIDRSQWLPSGSNMTGAQANAYIKKFRSQISGYVPNGQGGYTQVFNGVSDNIGPASGVANLTAKYPGRVLFELPGGKDLGNVNNMRFRVPSKMPCPHP